MAMQWAALMCPLAELQSDFHPVFFRVFFCHFCKAGYWLAGVGFGGGVHTLIFPWLTEDGLEGGVLDWNLPDLNLVKHFLLELNYPSLPLWRRFELAPLISLQVLSVEDRTFTRVFAPRGIFFTSAGKHGRETQSSICFLEQKRQSRPLGWSNKHQVFLHMVPLDSLDVQKTDTVFLAPYWILGCA